jgi:hypothetical protein
MDGVVGRSVSPQVVGIVCTVTAIYVSCCASQLTRAVFERTGLWTPERNAI